MPIMCCIYITTTLTDFFPTWLEVFIQDMNQFVLKSLKNLNPLTGMFVTWWAPLTTSEIRGGHEGKSVTTVNQTTNYMAAATWPQHSSVEHNQAKAFQLPNQFSNVSTLWYVFLSITPGSWTLFQVIFILHSKSHMFESTNRSICKTHYTIISRQMLHGKMFRETRLKELPSGYTSSSTLPLT